ncbi:FMN-binding protein [Eubacterium ramulus]
MKLQRQVHLPTNQIDAISGATITSKAVTSAVNAGLAYYRRLAQTGGEH